MMKYRQTVSDVLPFVHVCDCVHVCVFVEVIETIYSVNTAQIDPAYLPWQTHDLIINDLPKRG